MRLFGMFATDEKRLQLGDGSWRLNKHLMDTPAKQAAWLRSVDSYRVGSRIGDDSVFGTVHSFEPTHETKDADLYVLKRVPLTNKYMMDRVLYEAVFGEIFTDAPIPIVVAHRHNKDTGDYEILMQNILKTVADKEKYASSSLDLYYRKYPKHKSRVMEKVHDTLLRFYKTTKHFHGDLHLANLMVTYDKRAPHALSKVYVIDFGSSMPFLKQDWPRIDKMHRLYQFKDVITAAHSQLHTRENYNSSEQSTVFGPLVWLKHGGAVVHNLKQVQSKSFWKQLLNYSKKMESLKSHAL